MYNIGGTVVISDKNGIRTGIGHRITEIVGSLGIKIKLVFGCLILEGCRSLDLRITVKGTLCKPHILVVFSIVLDCELNAVGFHIRSDFIYICIDKILAAVVISNPEGILAHPGKVICKYAVVGILLNGRSVESYVLLCNLNISTLGIVSDSKSDLFDVGDLVKCYSVVVYRNNCRSIGVNRFFGLGIGCRFFAQCGNNLCFGGLTGLTVS